MMSYKKIHRFLVATIPSARVGQSITVNDECIAHQIHRVLKLQIGESITIFADGGNDITGEIVEINPTAFVMNVSAVTEVSAAPRTVIAAVSIVKGDAFELIVQKLTELGVSTIVPLISGRTIKQNVRIDRLQTISDEAVEQSGGTKRVTITEPLSLTECLKRYPFQTVVLDPLSTNTSLERHDDTMVCYVGPEGGWDEQDEQLLRTTNAQSLQVTTRVLRTETAAIVGIYTLLWDH